MRNKARTGKRSLPVAVLPVIMIVLIGQSLIVGGNVAADRSVAPPSSTSAAPLPGRSVPPPPGRSAPPPPNSSSGKSSPNSNPLLRVDPPADPNDRGDMTYKGGPVIDGIANIYLIFWMDSTFQAPTPKYASLVEQFIKDFAQSPLYANMRQYHDAKGLFPAGAKLAATFIDTHPFPQNLVAARRRPDPPDVFFKTANTAWRQEITSVATQHAWNMKDIHNLFVLLPIMEWGTCSYSGNFSTGSEPSSTYTVVNYAYYNGQVIQGCIDSAPQIPNSDYLSDIAIHELSHEIPQAVTNPLGNGWIGPAPKPLPGSPPVSGGAIDDRCEGNTPNTINPQTHGNVVWNGHVYLVTQQYDNVRHGCVLQGP